MSGYSHTTIDYWYGPSHPEWYSINVHVGGSIAVERVDVDVTVGDV